MKMKKGLIILMALAMVSVFTVSSVFAQAPIKWKGQCWMGAGTNEYRWFVDFCNRVKVMTNGRLEIEPFTAGAIVPVFETLNAVKSNVLQMAVTSPVYWAGKDPALGALAELPCAWTHPWESDTFFYYRGGLEMLREAYKPFGIYIPGVAWLGIESIHSKKPLTKAADLKGLKMRSPAGLTAEVLKRVGCSVVILPGSEVYGALEKGIIDATDWGTPNLNYKTGLHKVAKYFIYPGFHSNSVTTFEVNLDEWNKLPTDIKEIVETAVRRADWDCIQTTNLDDLKAVQKLKEEGAILVTWPEEEKTKVRKIAMEVWDDWGKKNPGAKKAIDAQKAWLHELGRL